jgi:hypothetical protein
MDTQEREREFQRIISKQKDIVKRCVLTADELLFFVNYFNKPWLSQERLGKLINKSERTLKQYLSLNNIFKIPKNSNYRVIIESLENTPTNDTQRTQTIKKEPLKSSNLADPPNILTRIDDLETRINLLEKDKNFISTSQEDFIDYKDLFLNLDHIRRSEEFHPYVGSLFKIHCNNEGTRVYSVLNQLMCDYLIKSYGLDYIQNYVKTRNEIISNQLTIKP